MNWQYREEGRQAFDCGRYRSSNPHSDSFGASYDERRAAREWEDGYRAAEHLAERKREDEDRARREQDARERNFALFRAEEEMQEFEHMESNRDEREAEQESTP